MADERWPAPWLSIPPYSIRPMLLEDIEQVMIIDDLAYPTPWKASGYEYELTSNRYANYDALTLDRPDNLIGYCGFWHVSGECHISTIAIHPEWQGKGLGELLFWHMQKRALKLNAELTTLEVRESNHKAQALYRKYDLKTVGRRRRYYKDRGEDALIMTVAPLDDAYRQILAEKGEAIQERIRQLSVQGVHY